MIRRSKMPPAAELKKAMDNGDTLKSVAEQYDVSPRTLYRWLQISKVETNNPRVKSRVQRQTAVAKEIGKARLAAGASPLRPAKRTCLRCGDVFNSTESANRKCFTCYDTDFEDYDPDTYSLDFLGVEWVT